MADHVSSMTVAIVGSTTLSGQLVWTGDKELESLLSQEALAPPELLVCVCLYGGCRERLLEPIQGRPMSVWLW